MENKDFVLSIVIPCYNEKDNIKKIVEKVLESPVKNKEIIVVDDCSSDGTKDILEKEIKPLVSKIVYQEVNQGKGAALKEGFKHATGDFVIIQDADMETCYKCFKREIIQSVDIEEKRFGFEPEITSKIAKKKVKIKEVPISYYPRTNEEGKKIGFKDGLRAIYCILKYR